jgi:hypothetical protein
VREFILSEIKRIAAENNGEAPGSRLFVTKSGVRESTWRGKIWARWGDALVEAGFNVNEWNTKTDVNDLLAGVIAACRHYGKFPTRDEMSLLRSGDASIPSPVVVQRTFGDRCGVYAALMEFVRGKPEFEDVARMIPALVAPRKPAPEGVKIKDGSVYLLKSGDNYKIGNSYDIERRIKEVAIAMPEKVIKVHDIKTDDPYGIEKYWHSRFKDKKLNGEWFKLTRLDVKAFMRRKFQ